MNFLTLWLTLNLTPAIAAFVLGYAYTYAHRFGNKSSIAIGSLWAVYSFLALLLPCLVITALIKYIF